MKRLFFFCLFCLSLTVLMAQQQRPQGHRVPATPHPLEYTQPNGYQLTLRLIGDERYHFNTTLDGYLIKQNKRGYYCYARKDKNDVTKVTCRKAHNEADRSKCEKRYIAKHIPKR